MTRQERNCRRHPIDRRRDSALRSRVDRPGVPRVSSSWAGVGARLAVGTPGARRLKPAGRGDDDESMKANVLYGACAVVVLAIGVLVGASYKDHQWSSKVDRTTSQFDSLTTRAERADQLYANRQAAIARANVVARQKTKLAASLARKVIQLRAHLAATTAALATTKSRLASTKTQLATAKTQLASAQAQLSATQVPSGLDDGATGTSSACDPNYEGACVPLVDYDLDCADVDGPVYVIGDDPHGLDGDGDGVGCEY